MNGGLFVYFDPMILVLSMYPSNNEKKISGGGGVPFSKIKSKIIGYITKAGN